MESIIITLGAKNKPLQDAYCMFTDVQLHTFQYSIGSDEEANLQYFCNSNSEVCSSVDTVPQRNRHTTEKFFYKSHFIPVSIFFLHF